MNLDKLTDIFMNPKEKILLLFNLMYNLGAAVWHLFSSASTSLWRKARPIE